MSQKDVKYRKNFLIEVILRVDFVKPFEKLSPDKLEEIKQNLSGLNIEYKENPITAFKFDLKSPSSTIETVGTQVVYELSDALGRFVLQNDLFYIQLNKYSSFSFFQALYRKGFDPIMRILDINNFKRIGLRYINAIRLDEVKKWTDWKQFVNSSFLPDYESLLEEKREFTLRKSMQNFVISDGEYISQVNHGIWNDNFPSKIVDHQYIVDIDCYGSNMIYDIENFYQRLPQMNILCVDLFRKIITQELESKLI